MSNRPYNAERLHLQMDAVGADAVIAGSQWNISYLTGAYLNVPKLTFALVTRDGRVALVINEADAHHMRASSNAERFYTYRFSNTTMDSTRTAVELLAEAIGDFSLANACIGVEEEEIAFGHVERLRSLCPGVRMVGASKALTETRVIKMPWEIETIKRAAYATDKAIVTAFASASPGDTEKDISVAIQSFALKFGANTFDHTVCSAGYQSTVVHAPPLPNPVREGEIIHVDFGANFEGYNSDISRTAVVGRASNRQNDIQQVLLEAEQAMLAKLKPGAVAKDIFAAGEQVINRNGLSYPWGTMGHTIGILVHDGFEITRTSERIIEENMVINVEPTHIDGSDARYHIENTTIIGRSDNTVASDFYPSGRLFEIR